MAHAVGNDSGCAKRQTYSFTAEGGYSGDLILVARVEQYGPVFIASRQARHL